MANMKHHYSATYEFSIQREIEKNQGITFSTYALLCEVFVIVFADRIYNLAQNTGKWNLLNDILILMPQFIHN